MTPIIPTAVYTTEEATPLLKVSRSTVQRWIKARRIVAAPGIGKHLILGENLIEFIRGNAEYLQAHQSRSAR
jgi:excisionase family DNA binding protein